MSTWLRRGYELDSLFWGRPVRPFHLALMISTGTIGIANVFYEGVVLTGTFAHVVGVFAIISAAFLGVGWWFRNEWFAEWGLLLAAGTWTTRAVFAALTAQAVPATMLSLAWVIGAAGAYLLERYDHEVPLKPRQ